MYLSQGVEREGRERRQTNEIRLALLGEIALEPVRSLDELVVVRVRADQQDRQPAVYPPRSVPKDCAKVVASLVRPVIPYLSRMTSKTEG